MFGFLRVFVRRDKFVIEVFDKSDSKYLRLQMI